MLDEAMKAEKSHRKLVKRSEKLGKNRRHGIFREVYDKIKERFQDVCLFLEQLDQY